MPQAFSVSTSVPVVPVAPAAPSVAGAAPAKDNSAPTDFLGQLKTALKNLTKAVKQPTMDSEPAPQLPASPQAPATDAPAAPSTPKDSSPVDDSKDALPDVLAALGFVPVPLAFAPPHPALVTGAAASAEPAAPAATAPAAAQLATALPQSAQAEAPQPAPAVPQAAAQAQLELSKQPQSEAPLAMPELPTASPLTTPSHPAKRINTPVVDSSSLTTSSAPSAPAAPTAPADAPTQALATAVVAPQSQPAAHQAPAATGSADVPPRAIAAAQHSAHQNFSGQGSADDRQQPTAPKAVERIDETPSPGSTPAAIDTAIAAAAGATVSNAPAVLPTHVRPAEVVSQIAHQADLYRLPGNRGVRVQLHPEDLGGVEVTLRYGAGGALQLHINVEHAATGSLVQAGWSQLRDALATQGISPDRLVMSVTAPASSSQLDFSGGGSGRQTDPGMASFAQSQSGQQRQDNSQQTGPRGWNGAVDPTSSSDDSPRVASTSAPTSRIDYRA